MHFGPKPGTRFSNQLVDLKEIDLTKKLVDSSQQRSF